MANYRCDRDYLTQARYDNLGRRIALNCPGSGKAERPLDLAGTSAILG